MNENTWNANLDDRLKAPSIPIRITFHHWRSIHCVSALFIFCYIFCPCVPINIVLKLTCEEPLNAAVHLNPREPATKTAQNRLWSLVVCRAPPHTACAWEFIIWMLSASMSMLCSNACPNPFYLFIYLFVMETKSVWNSNAWNCFIWNLLRLKMKLESRNGKAIEELLATCVQIIQSNLIFISCCALFTIVMLLLEMFQWGFLLFSLSLSRFDVHFKVDFIMQKALAFALNAPLHRLQIALKMLHIWSDDGGGEGSGGGGSGLQIRAMGFKVSWHSFLIY